MVSIQERVIVARVQYVVSCQTRKKNLERSLIIHYTVRQFPLLILPSSQVTWWALFLATSFWRDLAFWSCQDLSAFFCVFKPNMVSIRLVSMVTYTDYIWVIVCWGVVASFVTCNRHLWQKFWISCKELSMIQVKNRINNYKIKKIGKRFFTNFLALIFIKRIQQFSSSALTLMFKHTYLYMIQIQKC